MKTMKAFKKLFTNSIAIAVAVTHWLILSFAILGEEHSQPFHFTYEPLLTQWLFLLNAPALILASLGSLPFILIFGDNTLIVYFSFFLGFAFISLQWLIIGCSASYIIDSSKQKELNLSLFNE